MGADMIIAVAAAPRDAAGNAIEDRELIMSRITDEAVAGFPTACVQMGIDLADALLGLPDAPKWLEDYLGDELDPDSLPADRKAVVDKLCKQRLEQIVDELFLQPNREVTELILGTDLYVASGGMSWGDAPTEACDPIWIVSGLGLFDEPFPAQG